MFQIDSALDGRLDYIYRKGNPTEIAQWVMEQSDSSTVRQGLYVLRVISTWDRYSAEDQKRARDGWVAVVKKLEARWPGLTGSATPWSLAYTSYINIAYNLAGFGPKVEQAHLDMLRRVEPVDRQSLLHTAWAITLGGAPDRYEKFEPLQAEFAKVPALPPNPKPETGRKSAK